MVSVSFVLLPRIASPLVCAPFSRLSVALALVCSLCSRCPGYTLLGMSLGASHGLVTLARWYLTLRAYGAVEKLMQARIERVFGAKSDRSLCVTHAMKADLKAHWGVTYASHLIVAAHLPAVPQHSTTVPQTCLDPPCPMLLTTCFPDSLRLPCLAVRGPWWWCGGGVRGGDKDLLHIVYEHHVVKCFIPDPLPCFRGTLLYSWLSSRNKGVS